ncbi:MAG: SDR family NAD(P)-dependent oxidoreductase [Bacteroidota bacterium]|jgi:3-oxoacyl-[acyl-carrier protein] reductase
MKHALMIGASSGIGGALAKKLSVTHEITALSRTSGNLNAGNGINHFMVDIAQDNPDFPSIDKPIDALIYCPGTISLKPFRSIKNEDFLNDWNINVLGAIKTIRHYLPQLQQATAPSITLFSTVAVQTGMPFHASISAAKGAIEGLTRSLAAEFAPKIRVNAIAPSLTQTPLAEKLLNAEAKIKAAEERHPLKKIGTPDDIADAALFLINANWITGQIIPVDGGMQAIR